MKQPQIISEVMHQLVLNSPKDPYAQILRRCPFIQAQMLQEGYMSLDELSDEELDHIIALELEYFDIEEIKKRRPPISDPTITAITAEIDNAFSSKKATEIDIFTIKSANQTVEDAAHRPAPRQLYRELWYEGEACCLFADSNLGKSIFAVQIADEIARTANVLYVD